MYAEYTPSGAYFVKYEIFSPKMKKKECYGNLISKVAYFVKRI